MKRSLLCLLVLSLVGTTAMLSLLAQAGNPFFEIANGGADGDFTPLEDIVIDLSRAETAAWDAVTNVAGTGVYDAEKWAVVFKYSSVNIPSGVTVTFANHPSRAPVVWLVSGDVTIDGTVDLSGESYNGRLFPEPGPGGFRGGSSGNPGSAGFGPGGSLSFARSVPTSKSGGGYATPGGGDMPGPTYGNPEIVPLIGGSGGAGLGGVDVSGGAGGGALLIVAETITVNGVIVAEGGSTRQTSGAGSGGAIRLVARAIAGSGQLRAHGPLLTNEVNKGGDGRIRLESESPIGASLQTDPAASTGVPESPVAIWPSAARPTVRIVSIGGVAVPSDPRANLSHSADVEITDAESVDIVVETTGVEVDPDTVVEIRITPREGAVVNVVAGHTSGDFTLSTWTASGVTLSQTISAMQVLVDRP